MPLFEDEAKQEVADRSLGKNRHAYSQRFGDDDANIGLRQFLQAQQFGI